MESREPRPQSTFCNSILCKFIGLNPESFKRVGDVFVLVEYLALPGSAVFHFHRVRP